MKTIEIFQYIFISACILFVVCLFCHEKGFNDALNIGRHAEVKDNNIIIYTVTIETTKVK